MRKTFVHNRNLLRVAALVIFLIFLAFGTRMTRLHATSQPGTVWIAPSLVRVGPTDAPGTTSYINLSSARGETVDTQIIVTAFAGGLTNVNLSASALTGPGAASIPASNFVLYREYYVTVQGSFNAGGNNPPLGPDTYPEPLIPFVDPETAEHPSKHAMHPLPPTKTSRIGLTSISPGAPPMFLPEPILEPSR